MFRNFYTGNSRFFQSRYFNPKDSGFCSSQDFNPRNSRFFESRDSDPSDSGFHEISVFPGFFYYFEIVFLEFSPNSRESGFFSNFGILSRGFRRKGDPLNEGFNVRGIGIFVRWDIRDIISRLFNTM